MALLVSLLPGSQSFLAHKCNVVLDLHREVLVVFDSALSHFRYAFGEILDAGLMRLRGSGPLLGFDVCGAYHVVICLGRRGRGALGTCIGTLGSHQITSCTLFHLEHGLVRFDSHF